MSEVTTPIAEGAKESVEPKVNITMAELANRRVAQKKAQAPQPKAEEPKPESAQPEAEPKPEAEEPKSESQESQKEELKPKDEGKDVLSKVDLSELTDEDIAELAQKGKSGLLKRIAELTAKRKLAEERAAQLEAAFAQKQPQLEAKVENNPLSNLNSLNELQERYNQVAEVIEWSEDVLDRSENLGGDDVVATIGGQEVTKSRVREELRRARKEMNKYLPARLKEIQAAEQRKQVKQVLEQNARKELPWLDGEDNDLRKNYEAMVKDPLVERVVKAVPEIEAQLPYLLAHAANSIYGRKSIPLSEPKPSVKANPPSNPSTAAAAPERTEAREIKAVKEAASKVRETGSISDFIALRTAQHTTKRKAIK